MKTVHQLVATLSPHDAVTNEALALQDALREMGYRSEVFAEHVPLPLRRRARQLAELRLGRHDAVFLHYSIWSRAIARALAAPGPLILRYHNVTPEHWFAGVNGRVAELCRRGRAALPNLARRATLAIADSEFNCQELSHAGYSRTAVVPIVLARKPRFQPARPLGRPLVLTLGRIAPNKRIDDVLRVFTLFQRACRPDASLAIAGSGQGFESYERACRRLAERLGVKNVIFTGQVTERRKQALFRRASAYISLSEHEGFGIPLVEAMSWGVPVLARAAAAVPETLGSGGVAVSTRDHAELAELLDVLASDEDVRAAIRARQQRELERFDPARARARLAALLEEALA